MDCVGSARLGETRAGCRVFASNGNSLAAQDQDGHSFPSPDAAQLTPEMLQRRFRASALLFIDVFLLSNLSFGSLNQAWAVDCGQGKKGESNRGACGKDLEVALAGMVSPGDELFEQGKERDDRDQQARDDGQGNGKGREGIDTHGHASERHGGSRRSKDGADGPAHEARMALARRARIRRALCVERRRALEGCGEGWSLGGMVPRENGRKRQQDERKKQANEVDGQKGEPVGLTACVVRMRHDQREDCNRYGRNRDPEPCTFLAKNAHFLLAQV